MTKKTLLIILIIIIFIVLDVIFYVFFFQNRESLNTQSSSPTSIFPTSSNRSLENPVLTDQLATTDNQFGSSTGQLAGQLEQRVENISSTNSSENLMIAGLSTFKVGTTTKTFVLDKPSGNVFEYNATKGLNRLTNTTFPGVEEVIWGLDKNGLRLILRRSGGSLFSNTSGLIKLNSEVGELQTAALSDNLLSFAISPTKDKLFVINGRQGGVDGYIADFDLNNQKKIFSSPLSEWLIDWPNSNYIAFQTKPSADVAGYLFFLNINSNTFSPILKNINGLTTLVNPNADKIIYSRNALNSISTYIYDYKQDKSLRLSISTLPEKCVWSSTNNYDIYCAVPTKISPASYPDDWYQGKVQFSDNLWLINSNTGNVQLVDSQSNWGDLINLSHNAEENTIYAIDRNTKKLRVITLPLI